MRHSRSTTYTPTCVILNRVVGRICTQRATPALRAVPYLKSTLAKASGSKMAALRSSISSSSGHSEVNAVIAACVTHLCTNSVNRSPFLLRVGSGTPNVTRNVRSPFTSQDMRPVPKARLHLYITGWMVYHSPLARCLFRSLPSHIPHRIYDHKQYWYLFNGRGRGIVCFFTSSKERQNIGGCCSVGLLLRQTGNTVLHGSPTSPVGGGGGGG